jgi:hypothetical protein
VSVTRNVGDETLPGDVAGVESARIGTAGGTVSGVGVEVGVDVGVAVAAGVGVLVAVGVTVDVKVGVIVGVSVGVLVGVSVGVFVGVSVGVVVGVVVAVIVGVAVGVSVGVLVGVSVGVIVAVGVGVAAGILAPNAERTPRPPKVLARVVSIDAARLRSDNRARVRESYQLPPRNPDPSAFEAGHPTVVAFPALSRTPSPCRVPSKERPAALPTVTTRSQRLPERSIAP